MKLGNASVLIVLATIMVAGCRSAERDWKRAKDANSTDAYADFLAKHPNGQYADEAAKAIENLDWNKALSAGDPRAFFDFFHTHPNSSRVSVGRGTIASEQFISFSASSPVGGTASAGLEVTLDGVETTMSVEEACKAGILECKAQRDGLPGSFTKPPRLASVVLERESGRILAVDFAGVGSLTPGEAIQEAAISGNVEQIQSLLKGDPGLVSSRDVAGFTPLLEAANRGNKNVVELLLTYHADINAKDNLGNTPLHFATLSGHKDIADFLHEQGGVDFVAEIDDASASGDLSRVKNLLLGDRQLVSSRNKDLLTPLHIASSKGHYDVVQLLLSNGADVNAKTKYGSTPLIEAAWQGHKDVMDILLVHGAEVNAKGGFRGGTPLHGASSKGTADMVESLLAHGADASAKNQDGATPLFYANPAVSQLLLAHGADVNARDNDGDTPLHSAHSTDEVEWLLAHGANINAKDSDGDTPLRHFVRFDFDPKDKDIAKFLRQHGGRE